MCDPGCSPGSPPYPSVPFHNGWKLDEISDERRFVTGNIPSTRAIAYAETPGMSSARTVPSTDGRCVLFGFGSSALDWLLSTDDLDLNCQYGRCKPA